MRTRKQQYRPDYDLGRTHEHIRDAYGLIEDLGQKIHQLPPLKPDGSSDRPDAQERYDQKEEVQSKLHGCVDLLRQHLGLIEKEIQRCKLNKDVIEAATTALHHDDPKHAFTEAEAAQAREYARWVHLRQELLELLEEAAKALQEAGKCPEFPGLSRWYREKLEPLPIAKEDEEDQYHPIDAEVRRLLDMGPLP